MELKLFLLILITFYFFLLTKQRIAIFTGPMVVADSLLLYPAVDEVRLWMVMIIWDRMSDMRRL